MSKQVLDALSTELSSLEEQLKEFKSAVGYLKDAKDNVESAVHAVNQAEGYHMKNLSAIESAYARLNMVVEKVEVLSSKVEKVDFPTRLASIEAKLGQVVTSIDESTKAALLQLGEAAETIVTADFNSKFKHLDTALAGSISQTKTIIADIDKSSAIRSEKLEDSISAIAVLLNRYSKEQVSFITSLDLTNRFDSVERQVVKLSNSLEDLDHKVDHVGNTISRAINDVHERLSLAMIESQNRISKQSRAIKQMVLISAIVTACLVLGGFILTYLVMK